jgi:hypothetical protein
MKKAGPKSRLLFIILHGCPLFYALHAPLHFASCSDGSRAIMQHRSERLVPNKNIPILYPFTFALDTDPSVSPDTIIM